MDEKNKINLQFDPLATAKALTGTRDDQLNEECLMLALNFAHSTSEYIKKIGDTQAGMDLHDFYNIAEELGFKCGYCKKFTRIGYKEPIEDEKIIFFNKEKGLILFATTIFGSKLIFATLYGELKLNDSSQITDKQKAVSETFNAFSVHRKIGNIIDFELDVSTGLRFYVDALSEAFEFSQKWNGPHFFNFLMYDKDGVTKSEIEEIAAPEIKEIIFG